MKNTIKFVFVVFMVLLLAGTVSAVKQVHGYGNDNNQCSYLMCPQIVGKDTAKVNPITGDCYCGGTCGDWYCDDYEGMSDTCANDCYTFPDNSACDGITGDVNKDGLLNLYDKISISDILKGRQETNACADIDSNGNTERQDMTLLDEVLRQIRRRGVMLEPSVPDTCTEKGDLNGDGAVDYLDLAIMREVRRGYFPETDCADMDDDGVINARDQKILQEKVEDVNNHPPVIEFNFPSGEVSGIVDYSWNIYDEQGERIRFGVFISDDNGETWRRAPFRTPNDAGEGFFNTEMLNDETYLIKVTARDASGLDSEWISEPFTVNNNPDETEFAVSITADPSDGEAPLEVNFTCSVENGETPYDFTLEYTDGANVVQRYASSSEASHIFTETVDAGNYTATCSISDSNDNEASSEEVDVSVSEASEPGNHAPSIEVTYPEGILSGTVQIAWNVSDEDGDDVSFTVEASFDQGATWEMTSLGDWLGSTGNVDFDTTSLEDGYYMARVNATDEHNASTVWTSPVVEINNNAEEPETGEPEVTITADPTVGEDPLEVNFTCSVENGTSPYDFTLEYTDGTDSVQRYATADSSYVFIETLDAGNYTARCEVEDSESRTAVSDNATVTVLEQSEDNYAPVFDPAGPFTVNEGETLEFNVTATDPDSDDVTITADNIPEGAVFDRENFTWTPEYNQSGNYTVTFTATDSMNETSMNVSIEVINMNRAPVIEAINGEAPVGHFSLDYHEGDLVELEVTAVDPDRDDVTVTFAGAVDENGTWQTTDRDSGHYTAVVTASDGDLETVQYVNINVFGRRTPGVGVCFFADTEGDCILEPLEIDTIQQCLIGNDPVTIPGYSCQDLFDIDGDSVVAPGDYAIIQQLFSRMYPTVAGAPSAMTVADAPAFAYVGQPFNITVMVSDQDGTERSGIGVEFTVESGTASVYGRDASNVSGSWLDYVWGTPVTELTAPDTGLATVTVNATEEGTLVLDLGVEGDPIKMVNEFHETFQIQVINQTEEMFAIMTADPESGEAPLDAGFTCTVRNGVGPFDYTLMVDDREMTSSYFHNGEDEAEYTFNMTLDEGNYTAWCEVTDDEGNSTVSNNVTVTVEHEQNHAPVFNYVDYPAGVLSGTVNVSWNVTDPDGDNMTAVIYISDDNGTTWEDTGIGAWADMNQGLFVHEVEFDTTSMEDGTYMVMANVTDEHRASTIWTSEVIEINNSADNHAPVFDQIDDITMYEAEVVYFEVNATDADGDNVTLSAENLPEGAYFWTDELGGMFYGTFVYNPQYGDAGDYTVNFIASDGQDNSTMEVIIHVLPVAPENQMHVTLTADSTSGNEPLDVLFTCSVENGTPAYGYSLNVIDGNNSLTRVHLPEMDETYNWTVSVPAGNWTATCAVSDADNRSVISNEVQITVNDTGNHAPVFEPVADIAVDEGYPVRFNVTATDPDRDNVTVTYEVPEGALMFGELFVWVPQYGDAGNYTANFTATDGEMNTTMQVHITVNPVAPEDQMHVTLTAEPTHGVQMLNVSFVCAVENGTAPFEYSYTVYNEDQTSVYSALNTPHSEATFEFNESLETGNWTAMCIAVDADGRAIYSNEVELRVGETEDPNQAPVIELDYPDNPLSGDHVNFTWNIYDPDGDNVEWTAEFMAEGGNWDAVDTSMLDLTGSYILNTTEVEDGEYWLRLNATDEYGATTSETYLINISNSGDNEDDQGDDNNDQGDDNDNGGDSGDDDDDSGSRSHHSSGGYVYYSGDDTTDTGHENGGELDGDNSTEEAALTVVDENDTTGMEILTGDMTLDVEQNAGWGWLKIVGVIFWLVALGLALFMVYLWVMSKRSEDEEEAVDAEMVAAEETADDYYGEASA